MSTLGMPSDLNQPMALVTTSATESQSQQAGDAKKENKSSAPTCVSVLAPAGAVRPDKKAIEKLIATVVDLRTHIFFEEKVPVEVFKERQKALANMGLLIALEDRGIAAMDTSSNDINSTSSSSSSLVIPNSYPLNSYIAETTKKKINGLKELKEFDEFKEICSAIEKSTLLIDKESNAQNFLQRGKIWRSLGWVTESIIDAANAIACCRLPENFQLKIEAVYMRAYGYYVDRRYKLALLDGNELVLLAPKDESGYLIRVFVFDKAKQYDQAVCACSELVKIHPRNLKYYKHVIQSITDDLASNSVDLKLFYYRAICHFGLSDFEAAAIDAAQAMSNNLNGQQQFWYNCNKLRQEALKRVGAANHSNPKGVKRDLVGKEFSAANKTEGADSKDAGASANKKSSTDAPSTGSSAGADKINHFEEADKALKENNFGTSKNHFSAALKQNISEAERKKSIAHYLSLLQNENFRQQILAILAKQLPANEQKYLLIYLCFEKQDGILSKFSLDYPNGAIAYFRTIFEKYHEFSCIPSIMEMARERIFKIHADPIVRALIYFVEAQYVLKLHLRYPQNFEYLKQAQAAFQKIFEQDITEDLKKRITSETQKMDQNNIYLQTEKFCNEILNNISGNFPDLLDLLQELFYEEEIRKFYSQCKKAVDYSTNPEFRASLYFFWSKMIEQDDPGESSKLFQAMLNEKIDERFKAKLIHEYMLITEPDSYNDIHDMACVLLSDCKNEEFLAIPKSPVRDEGFGDSKDAKDNSNKEGKYAGREHTGFFASGGASSSSSSLRNQFSGAVDLLKPHASQTSSGSSTTSSASQNSGGSSSTKSGHSSLSLDFRY